jgi:telomere length regulation protein
VVGSILRIVFDEASTRLLSEFLPSLPVHDQRHFLNSVIAFLSKKYFGSIVEGAELLSGEDPKISGVAYVIHELICNNGVLKDHIVAILTTSTFSALDDSLSARRGIIAAIAQDEGESLLVLSYLV